MKYDYIKFIKDKIPKLAKNPNFDERLELLYNGDLNSIINNVVNASIESNVINSYLDLNKTYREDCRVINIYKKLNAIESYGKIQIDQKQFQSVSETIYQDNNKDICYSYAEMLQGPNGVMLLGANADKFNSYGLPDNINMGFWCYDNNTLKNKHYTKFLEYLRDYILDDKKQLNYYENLLNIQKMLSNQYLLPDISNILEAELSTEDNNYQIKKYINTLKNINILEQTSHIKYDFDYEIPNFKYIIKYFKDKYIDNNISYTDCLNITGINENIILNGYFDAIHFFESKQHVKTLLNNRKMEKQLIKK